MRTTTPDRYHINPRGAPTNSRPATYIYRYIDIQFTTQNESPGPRRNRTRDPSGLSLTHRNECWRLEISQHPLRTTRVPIWWWRCPPKHAHTHIHTIPDQDAPQQRPESTGKDSNTNPDSYIYGIYVSTVYTTIYTTPRRKSTDFTFLSKWLATFLNCVYIRKDLDRCLDLVTWSQATPLTGCKWLECVN